MPNEPERDIEKTLKAYAKQRRDEAGAPRTVHPATRKMLRDEALRVHSPARRRKGFWGAFWISRRFGLAAGVIAVLAIAAWIMLPGSPKERSEMSLAFNRTTPTLHEAPPPATPPAAQTPARELALADQDKSAQPSARPGEPANKAAPIHKTLDMNGAPGAAALADNEKAQVYKKTVATDSLAKAPKEMPTSRLEAGADTNSITLAAATPPPGTYSVTAGVVPASPSGGGGGFGGVARPGIVTEKFARTDGAMVGGTVMRPMNALPVLASFRLEQTNGQVRVIDSDGSVYAGFILQPAGQNGALPTFATKDFRTRATLVPEDTLTVSGAAQPAVAAGEMSSAAAPVRAQNVFFRVVGTNRSLNQSVLFTGSLQPGGMPPGASLPIAGTGGKLEATQGIRRAPASPSRVTGRVIIGGTNGIDVNAEATKP